MDMDEDSLAEGTYWISQVGQAEFEATLKRDSLGNFDEWEEVRQSSQRCIRKALSGSSKRIHFEDICDVVARYYSGRP
ncbi:MAG: hypothetical protein FH759_08800 [Sediminimonas qiaohouensis]|uniref:Uncharacterized protein n=1 Tax=Sediminimonas qiaohouensis TaxID=552061 RepID=A0A7C9L7U4_9RHOB|nr:hypothetical protein [Sediminimonas qiaohouensis]MTJ04773.1 hypothetical protein [Sediminimonas qiaohouensis]